MKKLFLSLLSVWLVVAIPTVPALLLGTGCATSQKTVAYQTLSAIEVTVDKAMQAYADRVVAGKVDAAIQIRVRDAYSKYQSAFGAAVATAQLNLASPAPSDVQSLSDNLVTLINAVTK